MLTTITIALDGGRLGIGVDDELRVLDVVDGLPAANAGLAVGMKIVRVNDTAVAYKPEYVDAMKTAIKKKEGSNEYEPLRLDVVKRIALEIAKPWVCEYCEHANPAYTIRCAGDECGEDHPLRPNALTSHQRLARRKERKNDLTAIELTDYESLSALLQINHLNNDAAKKQEPEPEGRSLAAATSFFGKKSFMRRKTSVSGGGMTAGGGGDAAEKPPSSEEVQWTRAQDNRLRSLQNIPAAERSEEQTTEMDLLEIGFNRFIDHGVNLMKEAQAKEEQKLREKELAKSKSWFVRRDTSASDSSDKARTPPNTDLSGAGPSRAKSFMKGMLATMRVNKALEAAGANASTNGGAVKRGNSIMSDGSASSTPADLPPLARKRAPSVTIVNPESPESRSLLRRTMTTSNPLENLNKQGSGSCLKRRDSAPSGNIQRATSGVLRRRQSEGNTPLWSRVKDRELKALRSRKADGLDAADQAKLDILQEEFTRFLNQDSGSPAVRSPLSSLGQRVSSVRSERSVTFSSEPSPLVSPPAAPAPVHSPDVDTAGATVESDDDDADADADPAPADSVLQLWSQSEDGRLRQLRAKRDAGSLLPADERELARLEAAFQRFIEHGLQQMLAHNDPQERPPSASLSNLIQTFSFKMGSRTGAADAPPNGGSQEDKKPSPLAALRPDRLFSSPKRTREGADPWSRADDDRLRLLADKKNKEALGDEEQAEYAALSERHEKYIEEGVELMRASSPKAKPRRLPPPAEQEATGRGGGSTSPQWTRENDDRLRALQTKKDVSGGGLSPTEELEFHELDMRFQEFVAQGLEQMKQVGSPKARPSQSPSPQLPETAPVEWSRAQDNRLRELSQRRDAGDGDITPGEAAEHERLTKLYDRFVEAGLKEMSAMSPGSTPHTSPSTFLASSVNGITAKIRGTFAGVANGDGRHSPVSCTWSRAEDNRLRELDAKGGGSELAEGERAELARLAKRYDDFIDEGVRLLAQGCLGTPNGNHHGVSPVRSLGTGPADMWSRADDNRLRELTTRKESGSALSEEEETEANALSARFEVFIQRGLEELLMNDARPHDVCWTRADEAALAELRSNRELAFLKPEEERELKALEARFERYLDRGLALLQTARPPAGDANAPSLWSRGDDEQLRMLTAKQASGSHSPLSNREDAQLAGLLARLDVFVSSTKEHEEDEAAAQTASGGTPRKAFALAQEPDLKEKVYKIYSAARARTTAGDA